MRARLVLSGLLLMFVAAGCASPGPRADWAVEGVTVIDARHGVRTDQRVVTDGDRIVWVGPDGSGGPRAERVVDGRGRYLIPGLFDAHVHFLYDEDLTDAMAELFLDYGVTSVRDTGGDLDRLVALRDGWRRDEAEAPRLFVAGPLLDGPEVVYDGATADQPPLGVAVPDVPAARERVRGLKARGADFIKIYELVRPDVFEALVDEARQLGLPIASHVPLAFTADVAGPRVDSMEHLRNIELACAEDWKALHADRREALAGFDGDRGFVLRKSLHDRQRMSAILSYDAMRCQEVVASLERTLQVPTLRLNAFNHARPDRTPEWLEGLQGLPPRVQDAFRAKAAEYAHDASLADRRFANWSLFLVGELQGAGVPIGAGTDTPIRLAIPGESLHRELELLVESGLSPIEALEAATLAPARFFSLDHEMGTISVGQRADLVLLGADPLVEIRNTRRVEGVLTRGRWRPSSSR